MTAQFEITIIAFDASETFVKQFATFLAPEIQYGVVVRGYPESSFWLNPPAWISVNQEALERIESTARPIPPDVLALTFAWSLTHLYRLESEGELQAVLWASLHLDDFPLLLFPANCTADVEAAILIESDNLGLKSHTNAKVGDAARWFITVNLGHPEDNHACLASRDVRLTEEFRRVFSQNVVKGDRLRYYDS